MSLMIHTADGHIAGLDEVLSVPVPEKTKTYHPVAHGELIEFVRTRVDSILGLSIRKEEYGLSRKDQQMFGVMTLETGNNDNGLAIGLRNSYDKSLSVGLSSGAQVFVCDNLCFSGSGMVVLRKHTLNVWRDIALSVDKALRESEQAYVKMNDQLIDMQAKPVNLDQGYEIIGRALGYEILKPQQATVALGDWREPRHEEFSERNMYSLYNCFTEGLKRGTAGGTMDRHALVHEFFESI